MKRILLFLALVPFSLSAQVTLQIWTERYGTTNGEQLGKYVTGITPSPNLPYRAAVSKIGSTGIYRLNSSSDTAAQQVFFGENLLTGDLNNDGYKDIVVGKTVTGYDTVFIYWGIPTGVDTLNPFKIPGENQFDRLAPGSIGDIDNDGMPDLILVAWDFPNLSGFGKVYVFLNPIGSVIANETIVGEFDSQHLGRSSAIGDLNNDGFNDLVIRGNKTAGPQSTWYDYMNIYWGIGVDTLNTELGIQVRTQSLNSAGLAVFDANGDGRDDLLWAIQDTQATRINVHFGRSTFDTIPDLQLQNPGVGTFGSVITNGGDMNGDGYNDVVVGCPRASMISGVVLVYGGGPNIDRFVDAAVSRGSAGDFGWSVGAMGDLTGDGLADIIVGAPRDPFFPPQQFEKGYWGVFKGDSSITVTSVSEEPPGPSVFNLEQAYPNPFNPNTTINYVLKFPGHATLVVFDQLGRIIITLIDDTQSPGRYETQFDGRNYASGVYYYRLTVRTSSGSVFSDTKRMVLTK